MAIESLDLENKLYVPTRQLLARLQTELVSYYQIVRLSVIKAHDQVAMLGKEFYDAPQETLALCNDRSVLYVSGFYADLFETVLPGVEANYRQVLTATSDFAARSRKYVDYLVEN